MASENNVISALGYFDGNQMKGNFDVQLKAKFMEQDLPDALQFVAGIGKRIKLMAQVENEKLKLGEFNVYSMRIDNNANCVITFRSNVDSVEMENLPKLVLDETPITFKAKVILE